MWIPLAKTVVASKMSFHFTPAAIYHVTCSVWNWAINKYLLSKASLCILLTDKYSAHFINQTGLEHQRHPCIILSLNQPLQGLCCPPNTKASCGSWRGDRRGVRVSPAVWASELRRGCSMGVPQHEGTTGLPFTLWSSSFCVGVWVKTSAVSFPSSLAPD